MKPFHPNPPQSPKAVDVGHKAPTENMLLLLLVVDHTARTGMKRHGEQKAPTGLGWQKGTTEQILLLGHTAVCGATYPHPKGVYAWAPAPR